MGIDVVAISIKNRLLMDLFYTLAIICVTGLEKSLLPLTIKSFRNTNLNH